MKVSALTLFRHIIVTFLAVFGTFFIMMLWAYARVRSHLPVLSDHSNPL